MHAKPLFSTLHDLEYTLTWGDYGFPPRYTLLSLAVQPGHLFCSGLFTTIYLRCEASLMYNSDDSLPVKGRE